MRITDLSHPFAITDMVFPGTAAMSFTRTHTVAADGYNLSMVNINTHAGTHTDAPLHFMAQGRALGEVPLEKYVGSCFVVPLMDKQAKEPITVADLEPYEAEIRKAGRVILATGWEKQFNTLAFFTDYPYITVAAAQYLVSLGICLVAVEGPSINPNEAAQTHLALLEHDVAIVEGVCNLSGLLNKEVLFCGAPLAISGMDGFPIRAYAIECNEGA